MGLRGVGSRAQARTELIPSSQDLPVLKAQSVRKEIQVLTRLFQVLLVLLAIPALLALLGQLGQLVRLVTMALRVRRDLKDLRDPKDPREIRAMLVRQGYRVLPE